jgi:predicted dithiol-disulfide oxidoreductase (DUF899 family)
MPRRCSFQAQARGLSSTTIHLKIDHWNWFLDLAPWGRNEDGLEGWWRRTSRRGKSPSAGARSASRQNA